MGIGLPLDGGKLRGESLQESCVTCLERIVGISPKSKESHINLIKISRISSEFSESPDNPLENLFGIPGISQNLSRILTKIPNHWNIVSK